MSSSFELSQYEEDFVFLKEMKAILLEELCRIKLCDQKDPTYTDSELQNGLHTETDDGRSVRIVLPNGYQELSLYCHEDKPQTFDKNVFEIEAQKHELAFVGFIGNKNESKMDPEVLEEVDKLDTSMVRELARIDGMLAYVTGERSKGGDYGNLVLFRDRGVIQNLLQTGHHDAAVRMVSPRFYQSVRIHSGSLPWGLESPFFAVRKTLFLNFTLPPEAPARRRIQLWRARREGSDVMKVLTEPLSV